MSQGAKILIISDSGMSSEAEDFLRRHIVKGPRLIAIHGRDCRALEDLCDQISEESDVFVATTSHPNDSLEDVIAMVKVFDRDEIGEAFDVVRI